MLSSVYAAVIAVRNFLFDRGVLRARDLGVYTVSVGNITAGGTGKTPLTAYIARVLADRGHKVCILTRGYGRKNPGRRVLVSDSSNVLVDPRTGGDEPVELAHKLLGKAVIVADKDRVAGGAWAKGLFGITAFVLDDGFQHRRAKRDLDIVCIDATNPFGNRRVLPSGILREPLRNLSRAHAIVVIHSTEPGADDTLERALRAAAPEAELFHCVKVFNSVAHDAGPAIEAPAPRYFAFYGVGNPAAFDAWLRQQEIEITGSRPFPDHHPYGQTDVDELSAAALASGADALLTTAKDAVKFRELRLAMPLCVAVMELRFDRTSEFEALLAG